MEALILVFVGVTQIFDLPPGLLQSVCFTESSYRVNVIHKDDGKENSLGLCQIHKSTARMLGFSGTTKQLMKPQANAYWAGKYLKHQLSRYDNSIVKAVAAYNSGTYRPGKKGLPKNHKYVTKVFKHWRNAK